MENENKELDKQEVKDEQSNKKKSNIFINILIIFVIFFVSIVMYAKYVGTKGIVVKEYRIKNDLIPENFSGVKIIYVSDVLFGGTVSMDDVQELVSKINERKADIVLFGGGLILEDYKISKKDKQTLIELFNSIEATLGKYATKGSDEIDQYDEMMTSMGFTILNNQYDLIYKDNNQPICLSGIGSYNLGEYDLIKGFEFFDSMPTCFSVVFTHEADIFDKMLALEHKPNVVFAGNTLGGEVRLPFYGPILKLEGSNKYYLDYYNINDVQLYVSSGIGTKKYDMRLFNRPSFNFYRLKS